MVSNELSTSTSLRYTSNNAIQVKIRNALIFFVITNTICHRTNRIQFVVAVCNPCYFSVSFNYYFSFFFLLACHRICIVFFPLRSFSRLHFFSIFCTVKKINFCFYLNMPPEWLIAFFVICNQSSAPHSVASVHFTVADYQTCGTLTHFRSQLFAIIYL